MANAGDDLGDSITGSDKHRCTTAVLAHQLSRGMVDYHGVAMTMAMAELWQRHTRVAQSEARLTNGAAVGAARWERWSRVRRSCECGRLEAGVAVNAGELDGAAATAMASAVSKGARVGEWERKAGSVAT